MFVYALAVRRLLYTTNAIENLHRTLTKSLKIRGHFPNDDAGSKLLYLALRNAMVKLGPHGAGASPCNTSHSSSAITCR